ncbi:hypothetical protein LCGC14_1984240 [marine sediment metagenome]|uniref:Sulfotransferase domain-containing protein n=1 Tax=marine sediment metagenome TaxID=412755 RepID=A0A0F9F7X3_9ZZZZ
MGVVWLAAYPRSGVTFLRHVIERVYNVPTYTCYRERPDKVGAFSNVQMWPDDCNEALPVHFVKTHTATHAAIDCPAIHLLRDGKDAYWSYANFRRDILGDPMPMARMLEELCSGRKTGMNWGAHALAWLGRPAVRMWFDDLIADPIGVVTTAVGQLNLPLEPNHCAQIDTFDVLQKKSSKFFRSGKTGQWKTGLEQGYVDLFDRNHAMAIKQVEALCRKYA